MNLLLDTHILLWFLGDSRQLSDNLREQIESADIVYVSVASLWEMAIKISLGKLDIGVSLAELIEKELPNNDITVLQIHSAHIVQVSLLPFHHRDPFDRLMIAQALVEKFELASADSAFKKYDVPLIQHQSIT